jgi:hypothetical protein
MQHFYNTILKLDLGFYFNLSIYVHLIFFTVSNLRFLIINAFSRR